MAVARTTLHSTSLSCEKLSTLVHEMLSKAQVLRKKTKIDRLLGILPVLLSYAKLHGRRTPTTMTYGIYWEGMLAVVRKDEARARAYFAESIRMSFAGEPGHANYGGVLSELALARLDGVFENHERAEKVVDLLADAGDLQSLASANEQGLAGASERYNEVRLESVFGDLDDDDTYRDEGASSVGGSSAIFGLSESLDNVHLGPGNDLIDTDQDLVDTVFTGREREIEIFQKIVHSLGSESAGDSPVDSLVISGPSGIGELRAGC